MTGRSFWGLFPKRLLREPTVHFVLLAGMLFLVTTMIGSNDALVIEIDRSEIEALVADVEAFRREELSEDERQELEQSLIEEEILVREAVARGLVQDDARIRDILVQKMLHVLSGDVIQPTEAELVAHYSANLEQYVSSPALTVDEVVVPISGPLPPALELQLRDGVPPDALVADLPLSPRHRAKVTLADLTLMFRPTTATMVFGAAPGIWVGPHHTEGGQHWFRVVRPIEPVTLPLEAVRERVRIDWIEEQETTRLQQRVDELRSRYSVVITRETPTR